MPEPRILAAVVALACLLALQTALQRRWTRATSRGGPASRADLHRRRAAEGVQLSVVALVLAWAMAGDGSPAALIGAAVAFPALTLHHLASWLRLARAPRRG